MPRRFSSADLHDASHADTEPFRIMVVYDDMNAGLGAQQYLDRIAGQVGDGHPLDVRFWKEDILSEPHLWRQASVDAAEVDLILFAMSTSLVLPTRIVRWVQKWESSLSGREVSFAVLANKECREHSLVKMAHRFLRRAAQFHETRFFKGELPDLTLGSGTTRRGSVADTAPAPPHRRDGCRAQSETPGR